MLEGTVRWQRLDDGTIRVRVTPQLIRIADDAHVWASVFDEPLSDVFRVQAEIAERTAGAMGVALLVGDQARERPTASTEAYEYYLRGNAYFRAGFPVRAELFDAVAMYQRAVELDSTFALAYARLSLAHAGLSRGGQDRSAQRLQNAKVAVEAARRHRPGLPEANLALAHYYFVAPSPDTTEPSRYDRAIEQLTPILDLQPNNSEFLYMAAQVQRRRGAIPEAAASFAKASELDPLAWSAAYEAGIAYLMLRRYDLAERYLARRAAIQPQWRPWPLAYLRLAADGDVQQVRTWLKQGGAHFAAGEVVAAAAFDAGYNLLGRRLVRSLCGDCRDALEQTERMSLSGVPPPVQYIGRAVLYSSMQQLQFAKAYLDSAAAVIMARASSAEQSGSLDLAFVYAALGRRAEALREAELASRRVPISREPFLAMGVSADLAEVYVLAGAHEKALDNLEWLLAVPSWFSVGILQADPIWDPIRDHPRFQALLAKYEK